MNNARALLGGSNLANFNKPPAPEPTTMDEVLTLAPAPFAVESPSLSPAGHTVGFVTIGEGTPVSYTHLDAADEHRDV